MSATTDTSTSPQTMKLCIEDDKGTRATYPMHLHDEVRVGRGPENEIQLFQRNISREHALFVADFEKMNIFVEDLESYTGIKLNGKRISQRCILRPDDFLQIGEYVITLEMEGDGAKRADQKSTTPLRSEVRILAPEHHARLVVVSNNLAGREFHLNRAELIIGREPSENDLVINHRSISRNHAKIVWKNEEFTIIDLSSANGIIINGSSFAAARLIRGAIIQLGHVKLRYVAPGEDYQYNPVDVDVNSLDSSGRNKQILSLIAFALAVFLFVRWLSADSNGRADSVGVQQHQEQGGQASDLDRQSEESNDQTEEPEEPEEPEETEETEAQTEEPEDQSAGSGGQAEDPDDQDEDHNGDPSHSPEGTGDSSDD